MGLICMEGTNINWTRSGSLQLHKLTQTLALNSHRPECQKCGRTSICIVRNHKNKPLSSYNCRYQAISLTIHLAIRTLWATPFFFPLLQSALHCEQLQPLLLIARFPSFWSKVSETLGCVDPTIGLQLTLVPGLYQHWRFSKWNHWIGFLVMEQKIPMNNYQPCNQTNCV